VTYKQTWVLDCTLDLVDTTLTILMTIIYSGTLTNSQLQSTVYSTIVIIYSLSLFLTIDSSLHTLSRLRLLSHTSTQVSASNS
jgi:hypothetical protein